MDRIAIVGNAGSGKSYLARRLASGRGLPVIDLDDLFWKPPGQYETKRPGNELISLIEMKRNDPRWIVEGVYGELVQLFLERAECLIWLDIPWEISRVRLEHRQLQRRMASLDDSFRRLLEYAEAYFERNDGRSRAGHLRLLTAFAREKHHLRSTGDVEAFLASASWLPNIQ